MDEQDFTMAVVDSGDVFLNGELDGVDPGSREEAIEYARTEAGRFQASLRSYLLERIEQGDYVGAK